MHIGTTSALLICMSTQDRHAVIYIARTATELPEIGTAYLVDTDGNVIAQFYDGNIVSVKVDTVNVDEPTVKAA